MSRRPAGIATAVARGAALSLLLMCWLNVAHAQSHSDLLFIIDEDGIGYTAQQTIFTTEQLMVIDLPSERQKLETVFAGPGSALYRRAHEKDPDKLTLASGSVLTRFRHRFTKPAGLASDLKSTPTASKNGPILSANLDQFHITMADTELLTYRVNWILPPNLEITGFKADEKTQLDQVAVWQQTDNMITFSQKGGIPTMLSLEYRVNDRSRNLSVDCIDSLGPSEWCSPDLDKDNVPDYRDLCIARSAEQTNASAGSVTILSDREPRTPAGGGSIANRHDSDLGCGNDKVIALGDVVFESGQTYLNGKARTALDKVAIALQRMPKVIFRIASHTDNAGYLENNRLLSENRADAVRHYLILRGVKPNQIRARGYGETRPAHDNRTPEGRRANRRVELQRLN